MRPSRWMAYVVVCLFYIATLAQAAEVRKLGSNDLEWGFGTTTSPAGKVVTKIPPPFAGYGSSDNAAMVDVRAFGAVGDGTTDDTAAIQAAIDNITAGVVGDVGTLLMAPGRYKISTTLQVYNSRLGKDSYCSIRIVSLTFPYADALQSTTIEPTFADKPAIAITRGAAIEISGISFVGKNTWATTYPSDNLSTYMTSSNFAVNSSRDTRYSPYCAIAVDPFQSSVPPDGGYPDLTSWYTTNNYGSTRIFVNNCYIYGFVVGIAISPAQSTQNAEDIHIDQVHFRDVKYAVSSGQSQTRANKMTRCTIQNFYIGVVGSIHGNQTGNVPSIRGLLASQGLYIVAAHLGYGPFSADDIFAENIWGPGLIFNSTAGGFPARWSNCHFIIWFDDAEGAIVEPYMHYYGSQGDSFSGCSFAMVNKHPFKVVNSGMVHFDSTIFTMYGGDPFNNLPIWLDNWDAVTFTNCKLAWNAATIEGFSHTMDKSDWGGFSRKFAYPGTKLISVSVNGVADYFKTVGQTIPNKYLGSISVTVNGDGTGSFSVTDADKFIREDDFIYTGTQYYVTDYVGMLAGLNFYTIPLLGIVQSVSGNTVTLWQVPEFASSATMALWLQWYPRVHLASTGDTHSNTTLDNVTNPTTWTVGDRISGTGIPGGAWVAARTDNVITLSISATATANGVRLYDADIYKFTGTAE